ncbi:hypothetical protein C2845_PM13G21190 [Panicum miliaceum]|uniref:Uncharacterized protein n=1 Tax=Panicum miliaceum TaxID=4540 RepID=A0A3L6RJR5_PANMI|nr:hypothetical protein C2845_PM13G21190 [Panicum miliaceum]
MDRRGGDRKRAREGEQEAPATGKTKGLQAEDAAVVALFEEAAAAAAALTLADGGEGAWQRPAGVFDLPWQKCGGGLGDGAASAVGWELRDDTFGTVVREPVQTVASAIGARDKEGMVVAVDHGTRLGQGVVSRQNVDRRSGSDRSSESTVSKDQILWNGEEMQEMESEDAVKREQDHDVAITGKHGVAQLRKESGRGSDAEARHHKAAAMQDNPSASLKKIILGLKSASCFCYTSGIVEYTGFHCNTAKFRLSSEQFGGATSKEPDAKAVSSSASHHTSQPDAMIRAIKNQLRTAKTYIGLLPSRGRHALVRDLQRKMRDIQQALGDATSDKRVHGKIRAMELTLAKIKQVHHNCADIIDRLLATLHSTEDQVQAQKQKANYVAQIAAKAIPKRLYCLALHLTNEYYSSSTNKKQFPYEERFDDPKLQHYALFSDNVLAAAVVVNSTLINAKVQYLTRERVVTTLKVKNE